MKTKNAFIVVSIAILASNYSFSQENEYMKFPAQISFVYPIGTHGDNSVDYRYNFSLNILTGSVGSVSGCEFGGLLNINASHVSGYQAGGIGNITNGNFSGMQSGGIFNISNHMLGFQAGGILNKVKTLNGLQAAGITNITSSVKGAQIGGISNINTGSLSGVQIAGIYNHTKRLNGFQLGLLNFADTIESGLSMGLISVVIKGHYDEWEISVSDYLNIGVSYKSGIKRFYNIYTVGANFIEENLWVAGMGFGQITEISSKVSFQPEAIYYVYFPSDFKKIRYTNSNHLKLGLVFDLNENIALKFAPGVYVSIKERDDEGIYGYKLSSIKPFYEENKPNNAKVEVGFGLSLGMIIR